MKVTKAVRLALELFDEHASMSARQFAAVRWPDGFDSVSTVGRRANGAIKGAGASLKAGAFLRRMAGAGYLVSREVPAFSNRRITSTLHYTLTPEGREALAQARVRASKYGRPGPRRRVA